MSAGETSKAPPGGRIILIHGPSSSGKSTLARAVQTRIDAPFWHYSIDHLRDAGSLPLSRIQRGDFAWAELRPAFFEGFHRSVAAFAAAGNDLIVEHILESEVWTARLIELLAPFDVFLVVLDCPLAELERRERERGNRRIGEAREDHERRRPFDELDLELDASLPADDNAKRLITAWRARSRPRAFERMSARQ
jgi:chloramphenicol 3-O phosphotransferase